ncbi:hypothetical protein KTQ42_18755 [Noviherbaspirillum sp. L7-7A]|uniref:hypothetical protein n=1 Tax=Noviherbaspirillum sp. L7-7A TaxID=2850560 RepID=UPI001C2C2D19|nr:hypothetical protein [Noviherbaspirillum sp. L7-7A]MBV0881335.1 hypothetical protein [Noviherbaspirillum sp. L7-7A]
MTAITHSHAGFNAPAATRTVKAAKAGTSFSARDFFAMLQQSFALTRAIPDVGRISAKDVAKVRAMLVDAQ